MINVAVIAGGYSSEIEISYKSVETVLNHLDPSKYKAYRVNIESLGWYHPSDSSNTPVDKSDFSLTLDGKKIKFNFAFITIHGTPGEDGKLQGYFDMLKIPYNTCGQLASTITFNKWSCNTILKSIGYPTAKSIRLRSGIGYSSQELVNQLSLPIFVKPNDGGSSFGVSKVETVDALDSAIESAFEHGSEVMVEAFMSGTEVTCGIFRDSEGLQVLAPTEIVSENDFFDYEAKYKGKSKEITPARISDDELSQVQSLTKDVYLALGLKGMARIDFIIIEGAPHIIEVNTTPGLSNESIIPQQIRHAGLTLEHLFTSVIEESL